MGKEAQNLYSLIHTHSENANDVFVGENGGNFFLVTFITCTAGVCARLFRYVESVL